MKDLELINNRNNDIVLITDAFENIAFTTSNNSYLISLLEPLSKH